MGNDFSGNFFADFDYFSKLNIYFSKEPVYGPWGGGAKFVYSFSNKLISLGHNVLYNLCDKIDLIICFDPRINAKGVGYFDLIEYRKNNSNVKIIQRIGDLGTHSKPELTNLIKKTICLSDFIIFPSKWAKNFIDYKNQNYSIIKNRSSNIFYEYRNSSLVPKKNYNIVAHHWSDNPKKGFKLYNELDSWCNKNNNYKFLYIGRFPNEIRFSNFIPPIANENLAVALSKNDLYVSASEEEAGANHVLEALAIGLPVLYHKNGGSIVEYCDKFGIEYNGTIDDLIGKIELITSNFTFYKNKALCYFENIDDTISEYVNIIEHILQNDRI